MAAADAPRLPTVPRVGHAARLGMSRRERFLVMGHLLVMAFALEDEEVIELLTEQFGWGPATQAPDGIMTLRRVVMARLTRTGRDLLGLVTLRRHESSLEGYIIRLFCVGMIVVVLPVLKLIQLGLLGFVLALIKVALAGLLVVLALGIIYLVQAWYLRRSLGRAPA